MKEVENIIFPILPFDSKTQTEGLDLIANIINI